MITWDEFIRIELRAGTIVRAEPFPEAKKPAFKLWIDFGPELGIKKSSAQEGTPNNEIPDLSGHPELNLNEDKTLLFEPDRNSVSEKGVQNKEQITVTTPKSAKAKAADSTQKTTAAKSPEDDALSFNFLYYIIQKFKISDIVEQ